MLSKRHTSILHDSLELPRIANRILNDLPARHQDLLLVPRPLSLLQREVDPPVPHGPPSAPRKLHHAPFALEEEQVLGVGDREGRVRFFRERGNLRADGTDEDLKG